MKQFLELEFSDTAGRAEFFSDFLLGVGALSVVITGEDEEPIFDEQTETKKRWVKAKVKSLFSEETDPREIIQQLKMAYGENELPRVMVNQIADQDWQKAFENSIQPMQFADKLWVCPSWHEVPDPEAINIIIDPGMAFGSGSHETTSLCLQWLTTLDLQGKTVIDYGCGSGILGIAASKLGAATVIGVDILPQALTASRENAIQNQVSEQQFQLFLDTVPTQKVDFLVANILLNVGEKQASEWGLLIGKMK